MIKVALKFCGGCDPVYDRVAYWEQVRSFAGDRIEWVKLENCSAEAVLLITGCERSCPEKELKLAEGQRIVSIKNGKLNPNEVAEILLGHWRNHDKNQGRLHQKP